MKDYLGMISSRLKVEAHDFCGVGFHGTHKPVDSIQNGLLAKEYFEKLTKLKIICYLDY